MQIWFSVQKVQLMDFDQTDWVLYNVIHCFIKVNHHGGRVSWAGGCQCAVTPLSLLLHCIVTHYTSLPPPALTSMASSHVKGPRVTAPSLWYDPTPQWWNVVLHSIFFLPRRAVCESGVGKKAQVVLLWVRNKHCSTQACMMWRRYIYFFF